MYDNTDRKLIIYTFLFLLTGCAPLVARHSSKTSLEFLQDGHTTKEEVTLKLGPSPRTIERETMLFYRLGKTKEGYVVLTTGDPQYALGSSMWLSDIEGKFSLVLVFDNKEVLQKHSVIPID